MGKAISRVADSGKFRVLYYGTFIANHGVSHIVEAARLLSPHRDITFELVGDGPERARVADMVRDYGLTNVDMVGWLDQDALRDRIAQADLCLGVFGLTPQSMMTVHNKIKESMAMAKPVLTGDSPAARDAFVHGRDLYLCRRADPLALAAAIVELQQRTEFREQLARTGRETVLRDYTIEKNGERFAAILQRVAERTTGERRMVRQTRSLCHKTSAFDRCAPRIARTDRVTSAPCR